jgi:hypothetical protein
VKHICVAFIWRACPKLACMTVYRMSPGILRLEGRVYDVMKFLIRQRAPWLMPSVLAAQV